MAFADTLTSESSAGVSAGYNSNPFLQPSGARAAESVAAVANLPATYTTDTQSFEVTPRLRFGETHGDDALLSNYQYLDAAWHINGARTAFALGADWHHDSTFYNPIENATLLGRNLHRQEDIATLDWRRELTPRSDLHLAGSWDKTDYSQSAATGLQSFSYAQIMAQSEYVLTERWQWTNTLGDGEYKLTDESYKSNNRFLQTAVTRALSERWSMTAQVGYSYLSTHSQGLICCQIVLGPNGYTLLPIAVTRNESRGSANYNLTLESKAERWVFDLGLSRSIQPSGLGALLTQDDVSLKAGIPWTERLNLSATLHASRLSDPLHELDVDGRRYEDLDLSATWAWTEHWTLQFQGTYLMQHLVSGAPNASGTSIYLNLLRQFKRIRL